MKIVQILVCHAVIEIKIHVYRLLVFVYFQNMVFPIENDMQSA